MCGQHIQAQVLGQLDGHFPCEHNTIEQIHCDLTFGSQFFQRRIHRRHRLIWYINFVNFSAHMYRWCWASECRKWNMKGMSIIMVCCDLRIAIYLVDWKYQVAVDFVLMTNCDGPNLFAVESIAGILATGHGWAVGVLNLPMLVAQDCIDLFQHHHSKGEKRHKLIWWIIQYVSIGTSVWSYVVCSTTS